MIPGPNPGKAGPVRPKPTLAPVPPVFSGPDQAWFPPRPRCRRALRRPALPCCARREGRPAELPDWPFLKGPPPHPCRLLLQRIYSHAHLLYGKAAPSRAAIGPQDATAIWQFYGHSFRNKQSPAVRQEQTVLHHLFLTPPLCPRINLNGARRAASCVSIEIPASMVCCRSEDIRNSDFRSKIRAF